jgi:ribosome maturation factor RimP
MKDAIQSILVNTTQLIEPVLEEMGFELVDVEYVSEKGRWILRIYVDKEGGITVDECARVSKELGNLIDVKEIFLHEYIMEVSSPGLNRALKKKKHIVQSIGKKIKIRMAIPINGRRNFTGHLRDFQNGTLFVETKEQVFLLNWQDVEKANLVYDFND